MSRANPKRRYLPLIMKADDYQLKREESGSVCQTSVDGKVFTLPDSTADANVIGATFEFERSKHTLKVIPGGGTDRIGYRGTSILELFLNVQGDRVQVVCSEAGKWEIVGFVGTPQIDNGSPLKIDQWDMLPITAALSASWIHHGKTIRTNVGGPSPLPVTLPAVATSIGMWLRVQQGTEIAQVVASGSDTISMPGVAPGTQILDTKGRGDTDNYVDLLGTALGWFICGGSGTWIDNAVATNRFVLGGNVTDHSSPVYGTYYLVELDSNGQLANSGYTASDLVMASLAAYTYVVKALNMISDERLAGVPPVAPNLGDAWVVDTWGSPYVDGDVMVFAGAGVWTKVAALTDPEKLRVVVNGTNTGGTIAGSFASYDKQIMEYSGGWFPVQNTPPPGFHASLALVVKDPVFYDSPTKGKLYTYAWASAGAGTIWTAVVGNFALAVHASKHLSDGDDALGYWVSEFIPVSHMLSGNTPPAAEEVLVQVGGTPTGRVTIRKFDPATAEMLIVPWQVPYAWAGYVYYSVIGWISESTAPASGQGVAFTLEGFTADHGESLQGVFGAAVKSAISDLFAEGVDAQLDRFKTPLSAAVSVTSIKAQDTAMLKLTRAVAEAEDDYAQDVGVSGIVLYYKVGTMAAPV